MSSNVMEIDLVSDEEEMVTLESVDKKRFRVKKSIIIRQSGMLRALLETLPSTEIIPIEEASGRVLKHIIDYMNLHEKSPEYDYDSVNKFNLTKKDAAFFNNVPTDDYVELLNTASFLNIPRLTDAGLSQISVMAESLPDDLLEETLCP